MPTMWGETDLEDSILGWFWLISKFWRDRSPQAMVDRVNVLTGLPEHSADLAAREVRGPGLALMQTPTPTGLASSMIRYHATPGVSCTERIDCDGCRQLDQKPRPEWTEAEADLHATGTFLMKLAAHRLAAQGHVNLQPGAMDGEPHPFGEDGMTQRFGITPAGLEHANNLARDGRWNGLVRGWKEAVTKAEFSKHAPAWLQGSAQPSAIKI